MNKQLTNMQQNVQFASGKVQTQGNYFKGKNVKTASPAPTTCWNCGDPTHIRFEYPKLPECFKCHKRGHLKKIAG